MVVVYSSRISGSETGLPMLMEHLFSFQHEIYWKKHDFKNCAQKRDFRQKSLTQFVELYTMVPMVGHPSVPVIPKHAIFGVQSC